MQIKKLIEQLLSTLAIMIGILMPSLKADDCYEAFRTQLDIWETSWNDEAQDRGYLSDMVYKNYPDTEASSEEKYNELMLAASACDHYKLDKIMLDAYREPTLHSISSKQRGDALVAALKSDKSMCKKRLSAISILFFVGTDAGIDETNAITAFELCIKILGKTKKDLSIAYENRKNGINRTMSESELIKLYEEAYMDNELACLIFEYMYKRLRNSINYDRAREFYKDASCGLNFASEVKWNF